MAIFVYNNEKETLLQDSVVALLQDCVVYNVAELSGLVTRRFVYIVDNSLIDRRIQFKDRDRTM